MRLMKMPKGLEILITNKCNLNCSYCLHKTSAGDTGQDLPTEEWLTFFSELKHNAVMNVTLEGGETFIRKDIRELLQGIVDNRMRFSILTNGTLITDDLAAFIASTKRCNSIQVSLDGGSSEAHDAFRGAGNFARAVNGIKFLQKYNVPVAVRVTLHKRNVHDLDGIAKLLLEDLKLKRFSTNAASYMGLCRQNADDVQLSITERVLAMKSLLRLQKKYNDRITADAGPLKDAIVWAEMELARKEGKPSLPGGGSLKGCGGVFSKIGVRSDGVMIPCTLLPHIELGRINKDNLREVWLNHPEMNRLRSRREIPLQQFEFCNGCQYTPYCTGNCPALSYNLTGVEDHPSPDACLKRFLEAGGTLSYGD